MTVDEICKMTTNATMLNALHACREGHPLNNANAFANAHFLAVQQRNYTLEWQSAIAWLNEQANKKRIEWENSFRK